MSDALADTVIDTPPEPPAHRLAIVIPFPADRRRDDEAEARRRHPTARTS